MENQTHFDLNTAMENWRNELAAQANLTAEVRRELGTHLRDAITGFQQRGLNDEESFWLACRRVGQPQQLGKEFVKVDPAKVWRDRVFWMAFGTIVFWQLTNATSYVEGIALAYCAPSLNGLYHKHWEILAGLPIFLIIYALTKSKSGVAIRLKWFFQGRFHLAMLMIILAALCTLTQLENIRQENIQDGHNFVVTWEAWSKTFFQRLLGYLEYSLAPLIFLIWFLPAQNRKTPRPA